MGQRQGGAFRGYLLDEQVQILHGFSPFIWRTDHKALQHFKSLDVKPSVIERWLSGMADYPSKSCTGQEPCTPMQIACPGTAGLKRRTRHLWPGYADEEEFSAASVGAIPPPFVNPADQAAGPDPDPADQAPIDDDSVGPFGIPNWSADAMRQAQLQDECLRAVAGWVREDKQLSPLDLRACSPTQRIYAGIKDNLKLTEEGVLKRFVPGDGAVEDRLLTCLPPDLWDTAIKLSHESSAHMSSKMTIQRLSEHVYFPGMRAEVDGFIKQCVACQAKTQTLKPQRHTLLSAVTGYPLACVSMDVLGAFTPSTKSGAKYLLTMRDNFTKWPIAIPLVTCTSKEIIDKLLEQFFPVYGFPQSFQLDNATSWKSALFKDVCNLLGIKITHSTPYHPASNGSVERMHRDLNTALRAMVGKEAAEWENAVPAILFAFRTNVHSATGYAPFRLMFNRHCSQPLELAFGNPSTHDPLTWAKETITNTYVQCVRGQKKLMLLSGKISKKLLPGKDGRTMPRYKLLKWGTQFGFSRQLPRLSCANRTNRGVVPG